MNDVDNESLQSLDFPVPLDGLPESVSRDLILLQTSGGYAMFHHTSGALVMGHLDGDQLHGFQVLEGATARVAAKKWAPQYQAEVAKRVDAHFAVGRASWRCLEGAFVPKEISEVYREYGPDGEKRLLAVVASSAGLLLDLTPWGTVRSWKWLGPHEGTSHLARAASIWAPYTELEPESLESAAHVGDVFTRVGNAGGTLTAARRWSAREGDVLDVLVDEDGRSHRRGFLLEDWSGGTSEPSRASRELFVVADDPAPIRRALEAAGFACGPEHPTLLEARPEGACPSDRRMLSLLEALIENPAVRELHLGGEGFAACLVHHRDADGFREDLLRRGPRPDGSVEMPNRLAPNSALAAILQSRLHFSLGAGHTLWAEPLGPTDLSGFAQALSTRIDEGTFAPPAPPRDGEPFPPGTYRSGDYLIDVHHVDGPMAGPRVRPVLAPELAAFLGDVRVEETLSLVEGFLAPALLTLPAQPGPWGRPRWTFDPAVDGDYARTFLHHPGMEEPTFLEGGLVAVCLELLLRAVLCPSDGRDDDADPPLRRARAAHILLVAAMSSAGLTPAQ